MYARLLLLLLLLQPLLLRSQNYPVDRFDAPLRMPVTLTGGFAEIRSNHFHSGIDLAVGGKTGVPVYAPADGWVSRVNISPWGGGKVLYIDHEGGYRTVYMHLADFEGSAANWVRDYQYATHRYAFDTTLPRGLIPIRRGQLIAHVGNTGSSGGIHLHYEIRHTHNDQTINPFLFGLRYEDDAEPLIAGIRIYPSDETSTIRGMHDYYQVTPADTQAISVEGRFHCGIYTYDLRAKGTSNKNGVFRITMTIDSQEVYRFCNSTFMFEETRAVNALIDYDEYRRTRRYYYLTRHLPNAPTRWVEQQGDGTFILSAGLHVIDYTVSDHKGNTIRQSFTIDYHPQDPQPRPQARHAHLAASTPILYVNPFQLKRDDIELLIPANTLYANDQLRHTATSSPTSYCGDRHTLVLLQHPLPPHHRYTLRLRVPRHLPNSEHLIIVHVDGSSRSAMTTRRDGEWLETQSNTWGSFEIQADTTAPKVKPLNYANSSKPFRQQYLNTRITDNLAGLLSYHCFINGEWQLGEYDGKTATLSVSASHLHPGSNTVRILATDAAGNTADLTYTLTR